MDLHSVPNGNNQEIENSLTKSYGTVKTSIYAFTSLNFPPKYFYQSISILLYGSAGELTGEQ